METYSQIEEKLTEQLALSQQKIALLNHLELEKRTANLTESTILTQRQTTSTGVIALMLEAKANNRREKFSEYNPFLLENDLDKYRFLNILKNIPKSQDFDFNFVIGGRGVHATPVRIISQNSERIICSLDAGAMFRDNIPYIENLGKALDVKPFIFIGGLQFAGYGCTMFSMHHLATMSKMKFEEIKDMFESATQDNISDVAKLNAKFVANIQSISGAERYIQAHPDTMISAKKSFVDHINKHKRSTTEEKNNITSIRLQNYALTYKSDKYLTAASNLFSRLNPEEVMAIVYKRTTGKILELEREYGLDFQKNSSFVASIKIRQNQALTR